ncbi:MAG: phosphoribosylglycinamide formyltransferase [Gammaproteobacteria bacterium]|nr:phosphoribosylglycinamide formyltransferase [Gammaproteobacteria bacterium]
MTTASAQRLPVVVLISGSGSNLQALIDATAAADYPARICAVISNRPEAGGLVRAKRAGIPSHVIDHRQFPDRRSFELALEKSIDSYQPGLVALAGFMRILTPDFVNHYLGRMLNIHPSLLPNFTGLNTHRRALDSGAAVHGASIHFVTPDLDGGPVVIRAQVPIHSGDDAQTLAARVLIEEHRIYPEAVKWFAQGRLRLDDHQALLDGQPVAQLEKHY